MNEDPMRLSAHMSRIAGRRYPAVERAIEKMDPEEQRDFNRFLKDVEYEIMVAKKTHRFWPGGPSIRV
jgi:hypothetical protein